MPDRPLTQQPYLVNLATPQTIEQMRFYVQNELQAITNAFIQSLETILDSLENEDTGRYLDFMHWAGAWGAGTYRFNDVVSSGGNLYVCTNVAGTTGTPGVSPDWTLMV